jgi:hypothetical protein
VVLQSWTTGEADERRDSERVEGRYAAGQDASPSLLRKNSGQSASGHRFRMCRPMEPLYSHRTSVRCLILHMIGVFCSSLMISDMAMTEAMELGTNNNQCLRKKGMRYEEKEIGNSAYRSFDITGSSQGFMRRTWRDTAQASTRKARVELREETCLHQSSSVSQRRRKIETKM